MVSKGLVVIRVSRATYRNLKTSKNRHQGSIASSRICSPAREFSLIGTMKGNYQGFVSYLVRMNDASWGLIVVGNIELRGVQSQTADPIPVSTA